MGDPETEVVVPRIKNDFVELLKAAALQKLDTVEIEIDSRYATTIVAVSGGYPNDYKTGFAISGLNLGEEDSIIFYAGAKKEGKKVVTSGGRVVCATAFGNDLTEALEKSKELVEAISFEEKYFRKDIGFEFINN